MRSYLKVPFPLKLVNYLSYYRSIWVTMIWKVCWIRLGMNQLTIVLYYYMNRLFMTVDFLIHSFQIYASFAVVMLNILGPIPSELYGLNKLTVMHLDSNSLTGIWMGVSLCCWLFYCCRWWGTQIVILFLVKMSNIINIISIIFMCFFLFIRYNFLGIRKIKYVSVFAVEF